MLTLFTLFTLSTLGFADLGAEQNLDDFEDDLDFDDLADEMTSLLEKLKRKLEENEDDEDECDSKKKTDISADLDRYNGLGKSHFHDFLPDYYRVDIKYHISGKQIPGAFKAMYDTGANVNVINRKEFESINRIVPLKIDSISKGPNIELGDGSAPAGYLGKTYISTTVSDSEGNTSRLVRLKFYVFETMGSADVIIGKNFMKEAGIESVTEFPKTHQIKFGGFENNRSGLKKGAWFCLIVIVLMVVGKNSKQPGVDDRGNIVARPQKIVRQNNNPENMRRRRIAVLADVYADEFERRRK